MNRWVRDKDLEKTMRETENALPLPGSDKNGMTDFLRQNMINGINFDKALERFVTGDTWLESVKTYAACTPDLLFNLRTVNETRLDEYRITVHGVKGSSYAIAADEVGHLAEDLENAARKGDLDFINSHGAAFLAAAEELVNGLTSLLKQVEEVFSKPKKPAPDKELLDRILEAAGSYNMGELDNAMEELEKYQYESQGDIVPWLKEQIEMSEFEQIQERLLQQQ
jgi:HPt (histidine-containing phosphotransfer) domain-containing protein